MYGEIKIVEIIKETNTYLKKFFFEKNESIKIMKGKNIEKNFVKNAIDNNMLKMITFLSEMFLRFFNFK